MNPRSPDDAEIEAWLRSNRATEPLPDEGFSTRVMAALPPPQPARVEAGWVGRRLLAAATGAGFAAVLLALRGNGPGDRADDWTALIQQVREAGAALANRSNADTLGIVIVALAFVYWRELSDGIMRILGRS